MRTSCEQTKPGVDGRRGLRRRRSAGFTILELMVVVATIGTMAALAIPSLQKYVHRAQRNEAYINLNGIFKAQKSYQTDTGVYGEDFDAIGFSIIGGILLDANTIESKYYTYTVNTWDDDGIPNSNFTAIATGDLDPRDAMLDIVMIESGLIVLD